jgi:hypothetical protein
MKSIERVPANTSSVFIQLLLFFCYLIFGALVFQALELENETRERRILLNSRRDLQKKYNVSEEDLRKFIKLVQAIADQGFSNEWVERWNFIGALFFSGTVVTTIGKSIKEILLKTTSIKWFLFCTLNSVPSLRLLLADCIFTSAVI